AVQVAAAAAIALGAPASWWPAVFSAAMAAGGPAQAVLAPGLGPGGPLLLGAVLVAPGLWVAVWAWGWCWPPAPGAARPCGGPPPGQGRQEGS
ncbi:hypothetical protein, partial [Streptomonospora nanhaiensis]